MAEITHTIMPNNGGWGGTALGAGVGGLLGSWLGNGGFGGLGYRGAAGAAVGYDTGAINAIQNQLGNVQTQIANADRDLLMQTSGQNQFVGNLINATGDAIVGAVNAGARDTQAGIFQNTLTQTQNQGATNLAMCQGFGAINQNITAQSGESRLQAQELAAQQQQCCCQVLRAIEQEGCANRELQREIQTQSLRDTLANSQAENQALKAQIFGTANNAQQTQTIIAAMTAQTQALINALKPTTATAGT